MQGYVFICIQCKPRLYDINNILGSRGLFVRDIQLVRNDFKFRLCHIVYLVGIYCATKTDSRYVSHS